MPDPKPEGPNALFLSLMADIDDAVRGFLEKAPPDKPRGTFALNKRETHELTATLIELTSKLRALEQMCGETLRTIAAARNALGDPVTDEELEAIRKRAQDLPLTQTEAVPATPTADPKNWN